MKKITVCRLCSACCPVEVEISDGKLLSAKRITPFEKVIPCPKLSNTSKIVYSKDRVLKPLLRKNLNDDFKESYWQEALDFIAEKIEKIKEKYSSESIALYRGMAADWGTPWDYAVRLLSAIGSPNAIGNGSVCFVARNMAHTYTYGAITIPQVKDSKCIIVWGKNDRNTLPTMAEAIIYAKEKGAFLIVIDPTKTYFAEMADLWIQIKPGHDGLLALGIIKEIIENKLYDKEFVEKHCIGFEALEKTVKSLNTSEITEKTGITEDKIKKLARIYATTKPACIIDGNGLDMHINVFQTHYCW
ncbi:molybdopterin-containing oxidoreductase family protein [Thermodesulfovibrio hydrogeniphilus]